MREEKEQNPSEGKYRETKDTKVQKKYKKSDIVSVKNVLILAADLSPNWWVGT